MAQRFTIPIRYSGQDFDQKQARAFELTDADRAAGRPAPAHGYSLANFEKAEQQYKEAYAAMLSASREAAR